MSNSKPLKDSIVNALRIKSHSINTLNRDISSVTRAELLQALNELIKEGTVTVRLKDPTDPQTEDRYYTNY